MRSLTEIVFSTILMAVMMLPLFYSVLFLFKAILKKNSTRQVTSFFQSPFKSRLFNVMMEKTILSILFLIGIFVIYFGISAVLFHKAFSSALWNIIGAVLFVSYYFGIIGVVQGFGRVSGAGGSTKKVYGEIFNIFTKRENEPKISNALHNKANSADKKSHAAD